MVCVILYLSFDTETYLIVRYLLRSSWKTDCISFGNENLGIINEIGLLEEKLRKFVFSGDEADEQAFIYHYQTDCLDRLCVGDGSDK
jgi:hypothetical protein